MSDDQFYKAGFFITAIITFVGCWIYCIYTYGFFLGVGLGWLPALITAVIAGFLWPLIVLVIAAAIVLALIFSVN